MLRPIACLAVLLSLSQGVRAERFPLEWNPGYEAGVPCEVEISRTKLGLGDAGFSVSADGQPLPVKHLPGRDGAVRLRFEVPPRTRTLTAATAAAAPVLPAETDSLLTEVWKDPTAWKGPSSFRIESVPEGLLMTNTQLGPEGLFATCSCDVPPSCAGRPAVVEIDCENAGELTWGGVIRLNQYDAAGRRLPETVVDPRWMSHMRPPRKLADYRQNGRLHPEAVRLEVAIELRSTATAFDAYGLPIGRPERALAKLLLRRLAVRPAEELPFPKYADGFFTRGVSGRPGDAALVFGGPQEHAFFYATRGMASWSNAEVIREERQIHFPSGDGTVEAWFRPSHWPSQAVTLFEGSHHNCRQYPDPKGRGVLFSLAYQTSQGRLSLLLKDKKDRVFSGEGPAALPVGTWSHIAVQWVCGGQAEVFVNGRRAFAVPLPDFAPLDLAQEKFPNDAHVVECYLGSSYRSARACSARPADLPYFEGAVDLWRVSTGVRYADGFTPAKELSVDTETRALFGFDRRFDGVSGGGERFVRGSVRALVDRVDHVLRTDRRTVQYFPAANPPENDPYQVLAIDNYPVLPSAADYRASRKTERRSRELKPGEVLSFSAPEGTFTDFVEIANTGSRPLVYPTVLNTGDIDPRSFGDFAETLAKAGLDDRARAIRIFQYVINAGDYFMNHPTAIAPGSDVADFADYQALTMLNAYCGLDCGPLNNMTANLFACGGDLLACQTPGYAHTFEQVFFDGKNHVFDLSFQKFIPSLDNESTVYLEEAGDQPGAFHRIGLSPDHFIRNGWRLNWVQNPSFREKVAMILNPGERFRAWFLNDGAVNDLQTAKSQVEGCAHHPKTDFLDRCHAVRGGQGGVWRINRFFPHYGNGFLVYDGPVVATNPAFAEVVADHFTYRVKSCYPIVAARYDARLKTGGTPSTEISTDRGRTWRPLPDGRLEYEVRARTEYLVRVHASPSAVTRFVAETEVAFNPRVFPGRVRGGENALCLKAASGDRARVTIQFRRNDKPIFVRGSAHSGILPGAEHELVVLDPRRQPLRLEVEGVSAQAKAAAFDGLEATLKNGTLVLTCAATVSPGLKTVRIVDGPASKPLTVLVSPGVQYVPASAFRTAGDAERVPASATCVQETVMCRTKAAGAVVPFRPVDGGRCAVLFLDRFASYPENLQSERFALRMPGVPSAPDFGSPRNDVTDYAMFHRFYGSRTDSRAHFKWDFPKDPKHRYYTNQLQVFELPAGTSSLDFALKGAQADGVEVAGVLLVPDPDEALVCGMLKVLCGYNCQPGLVAATDDETERGERRQ